MINNRKTESPVTNAGQGVCQIRAALGAIYCRAIGYNPFIDDPNIDAATVAQTLCEAALAALEAACSKAESESVGHLSQDDVIRLAAPIAEEFSLSITVGEDGVGFAYPELESKK